MLACVIQQGGRLQVTCFLMRQHEFYSAIFSARYARITAMRVQLEIGSLIRSGDQG